MWLVCLMLYQTKCSDLVLVPNYVSSETFNVSCSMKKFMISTCLFVLIGSKTSCHSSADASGQQDKNRSYKDADSSGSPDQWTGFW